MSARVGGGSARTSAESSTAWLLSPIDSPIWIAGGDNRRAERHHPDRNDEALRLIGGDHALPVWRQRRAFGVGVAQEACRPPRERH